MTEHASRLEAWFRDNEPDESIVPAATVVIVRDGAGGIETLMLRKNSKLAFGGMWVFPGGRIDAEDIDGAPDAETAARRAAAREAVEEAGMAVVVEELAWFAHWTPPPIAPRRFATWFFVGPAADDHIVTIDGGEIHESDWMRPADALVRRDAGEVELAPPTWMTLRYMSEFADVASLMADAHARVPEVYETIIVKGDDGLVAMWAGDAGYEAQDPTRSGPRHRLHMSKSSWTLEKAP
jgi:8-oxo-dGTP pyrophosphatase MutT (NUDIX family)